VAPFYGPRPLVSAGADPLAGYAWRVRFTGQDKTALIGRVAPARLASGMCLPRASIPGLT